MHTSTVDDRMVIDRLGQLHGLLPEPRACVADLDPLVAIEHRDDEVVADSGSLGAFEP
jgi:hypothetical protein